MRSRLEMRKTEASRVFQISRNTINLWFRKREQKGHYKAEVGYQKGYNPKITDVEKCEEFAQAHASLTQKEIAEKWTGKISDARERGYRNRTICFQNLIWSNRLDKISKLF